MSERLGFRWINCYTIYCIYKVIVYSSKLWFSRTIFSSGLIHIWCFTPHMKSVPIFLTPPSIFSLEMPCICFLKCQNINKLNIFSKWKGHIEVGNTGSMLASCVACRVTFVIYMSFNNKFGQNWLNTSPVNLLTYFAAVHILDNAPFEYNNRGNWLFLHLSICGGMYFLELNTNNRHKT